MIHYLSLVEKSLQTKWSAPLLCNYRGESFTGADIATYLKKFELLFNNAGINKGEKIALCASNTARWAVSFLSINAYEAVVVPILADFHPDSINNLVAHSESVILFCDKDIWQKLNPLVMPELKAAIATDDFSLLYSKDDKFSSVFNTLENDFAAKFPNGVKPEDISLNLNNLDNLAVINYTSGTTSSPKGVMLSYKNFSASISYGHSHVYVDQNDTLVSMLPLAHVYGMVYEFLYPFSGGCTIYFLGKTPAPSLLLKAMAEVKPYMIATVPLVMEKIYKNSLKPVVSKTSIKILSRIPGINTILFKAIRCKLDSAFGGRVRIYIMGGAALNPEVEKWFKRIHLHYTVGYGMTEAAPLLGYEGWEKYKKGSCGKPAACDIRIDSEDPHSIVGEIQVKGDNITCGYFKNEEATKASFTDDGYFKTGDLGIIDHRNNIFIRGRSKNMILSANGQNIYPEEIEAIVNNQQYVIESVVLSRGGKLIALTYLDQEKMTKDGMSAEDIDELTETIVINCNKSLPNYSKLSKLEIMYQPFEKTPKMSIKRFLYR